MATIDTISPGHFTVLVEKPFAQMGAYTIGDRNPLAVPTRHCNIIASMLEIGNLHGKYMISSQKIPL